MNHKIFSFLGLLLAVGVLAVSVVRSSEHSAYAFVVPDEERPVNEMSLTHWWQKDQIISPGSPVYMGGVLLKKMKIISTKKGVARADLYLEITNERMEEVEDLMRRGDYGMALKTTAKGVGYLQMAEEELNGVHQKDLLEDMLMKVVGYEQVLGELKQYVQESEVGAIEGLEGELKLIREKADLLLIVE